MSFGFSVGDFIAVSRLIANLVSALRSTSSEEYRDLVSELDSLQETLTRLQNINCTDDQRAEVEALKAAAVSCKSQIDDFATKLEKFESLSKGSISGKSKNERAKAYFRKLEWGFTMQDEVVKMKTRIAAHVGYLDMRMMIIGLSTNANASSRLEHFADDFRSRLSQAQDQLIQLQGTATAQQNLLGQQGSYLQTIMSRMSGFVPQMSSLAQIILSKIRAIIIEQFGSGPGAGKVAAGEYCVTASHDPAIAFNDDVPLIPGSSLTMAMVIGINSPFFTNACPRPGCLSKDFRRRPGGVKECKVCTVNFHIGSSSLERPFRFPDLDFAIDESHKFPKSPKDFEKHRPKDHQCGSHGRSKSVPHAAKIADAFRAMRNQRKLYKHVRLTLGMPLPRFYFQTTKKALFIPERSSTDTELFEPTARSSSPNEDSALKTSNFRQSVLAIRRHPQLFQRVVDIVAAVLAAPDGGNGSLVDIVDIPLPDLGVDSLDSVEIIVRMENELGLDLERFFLGGAETNKVEHCLAHLLDPLKF